MKLFEIAIPDPSDFRAGDQHDPRSPYYNGPDEEMTDPMPSILKPLSHGRNSVVFDANSNDDGSSAVWKIDVDSPEAAQVIVKQLQDEYDLKNFKVNVTKANAGNTNDPEEDYYELQVSYTYAY